MKIGKTKYSNGGNVRVARYGDGRKALVVLASDGQREMTATVNIPECSLLGPDEVFIKEWGENEGILQALITAQIVTPTDTVVNVGQHDATAYSAKLLPEILGSQYQL